MDPRLAAAVQRLRAEVDGLRRAQRGQAVIEQAKGVLMARLGCGAEEAFAHLVGMSQRSNTRVVEVAAGVVGVTAPVLSTAVPALADSFRPETYVGDPPVPSPDATRPPVVLPDAVAARYHLTCAAMAGARDANALAEVVWAQGLRQLGATALVLSVLEPDGAVRLVGAYGLPASLVSQWRRVPGSLNVAFLRAVADGRALWLSRQEAAERGYDVFGEGEMRACLPLRHSGRVVGAFAVIWSAAFSPDATTRAYVSALADACAGRLSRVLVSGGDGAVAAHWLESVVHLLPGSVALVCPVRDERGAVIDWRFDVCSPQAVDASGRTADNLVGRRMVELYPHAVGSGLLEGYERAWRTGVPFEAGPVEVLLSAEPRPFPVLVSVRAVRFGDGLLFTWRYHDAERTVQARLERLQRVGESGWAEWNLVTGQGQWSPSAYEILRRDPAAGPVRLPALHRLVAAEDAAGLREAVRRLVRDAVPADLRLRLRRHGDTAAVRLVADPVTDRHGGVVAVHAVVRRLPSR